MSSPFTRPASPFNLVLIPSPPLPLSLPPSFSPRYASRRGHVGLRQFLAEVQQTLTKRIHDPNTIDTNRRRLRGVLEEMNLVRTSSVYFSTIWYYQLVHIHVSVYVSD